MKFSRLILLCCFLPFICNDSFAQNAPLPFRTAIELAVRNSAATGMARADVQRTQASYTQARDLFVPQVTVGSGLAFSYGFPLSLEGSAP